MRAMRSAGLFSMVLFAACTAGGSPSPAASPSPTPTASPAPSAADFSIEVSPPEEPPEVRMAIPGQRICFLVVVKDASPAAQPVTISATATKAKVGTIQPVQLVPGSVGEVWVVPDAADSETRASATITATRGSVTRTETRTIPILPMADERAGDARPYFERWVTWLQRAHPALGITTATTWEPQFVSTLLVVSHYAYFSDEWEMTVAWHNMIPPYDWTEIHLRHRGVDVRPSLAFRIDSVAGGAEPHPVEPPEVVVR